MKTSRFVIPLVAVCLWLCFYIEALAVRPPLKPLDMENLRKIVADAEVIAVGRVTSVTRSKVLHPPRETVSIQVDMAVERVLKGDKSIRTIAIEESYEQFSPEDANAGNPVARKAGPAPAVGVYREGDRMLVCLKRIDGSNLYRPLGSGNYNAYLGVFQISPDGIASDRYMFDEALSKYAAKSDSLLALISSMIGK